MASNADKLIAQARAYVNHTERGPARDNYGSGTGSACFGYSSKGAHVVDDSNIAGGYGRSNTPWCANFLILISNQVGYKNYQHQKNGGIGHGYTGYMWDKAKAKGWLKSTPVPGSIGIKNGKHVFLVVTKPNSSGYYESIGGNESDKVRHATRHTSEGWSFIVPPDLGSATGSTTKTMYAFEDLHLKPKIFGGWPSKQTRDDQYDKRAAYNERENTGRWLRKVKVKGNYAFEEGEPGTWGQTYNFGGWESKASRDKVMADYQASNPGRPLRTYNYKKTVTGGGGATGTPDSSGDTKYT